VAGFHSAEVAKALAGEGIFASNGNFYATGMLKSFRIGTEGLVRAGCACYTKEDEVDRLIESVRHLAAGK
jgi:selenocysteine lyase/cysteine desulfurase